MTKLSHIVGKLFVRYHTYINHSGCLNVMQVHFSMIIIALWSFRHNLKAAYNLTVDTLDSHTFAMHIRKEVYFYSFFYYYLKNGMIKFSFRLCLAKTVYLNSRVGQDTIQNADSSIAVFPVGLRKVARYLAEFALLIAGRGRLVSHPWVTSACACLSRRTVKPDGEIVIRHTHCFALCSQHIASIITPYFCHVKTWKCVEKRLMTVINQCLEMYVPDCRGNIIRALTHIHIHTLHCLF